MADTWQETIYRQREELANLLHQPLAQLAAQCVAAWCDRENLNQILLTGFADIPHCTYLYVLDLNGVQVCDNISRDGLLPGHFGRDRSQRPYMREAVPAWGFLLSDAYISQLAHRPSLTALHVIRSQNNKPLGYLGADFDLRNLPVTAAHYEEPGHWRQIKGDPSIRSTVFQQTRAESPMDRNMDQAFSILEELLTERGMFQGVIHFSSSRVTAWFVEFIYNIGNGGNTKLVIDEFFRFQRIQKLCITNNGFDIPICLLQYSLHHLDIAGFAEIELPAALPEPFA